MSKFEAFWNQLLKGVGKLAEAELKNLKDAALDDAKALLEETQGDLKRWAQLLEEGKLTRDDMAFLVQGRLSVAEMHALKRAGLTLAEIDRFRRSLINLFIDTAFSVFVPF